MVHRWKHIVKLILKFTEIQACAAKNILELPLNQIEIAIKIAPAK